MAGNGALNIAGAMLFGAAALSLTPISAGATTLTMESVFNRAPGSGPAQPGEPFFTFGLYEPDLLNPADGQPFLTASAPGEIARFPAGFPRDESLVNDLRVYNNTAYNITSLTLRIVGSAVEPTPFNFTFTLDPNVSAFWGDVNGDGKVGLSDIFSTLALSQDHRAITFSNGLIPVGGRFTDFIFSMTDDGQPFQAAIYASFEGFLAVPEPATWAILLVGLSTAGVVRRRTRPVAGSPRSLPTAEPTSKSRRY